jgi:iron complex outermembrane receptor protein
VKNQRRNTVKYTKRVLLVAAVASANALAQGNNPGFALEEVIVTAQKRAQNLQDVAVSAQAFSGEDIRVMGLDSVADLIYTAPSLNAGGLGSGSQQQMGLRGVVDYSRNPGVDPRMGVYIDQVYQGQGYSADQPLLGLETVEILRGPQGTLFGKNTVSGAINLVTKKPSESFEGEFAVSAGNEGQARYQAYVSGGITDTVSASLALTYDERDGLYQNTVLNKVTGDYDRTSGRAKIHWAPNEKLEATFTYDFSERASSEPVGVEAALPAFETRAGFESRDNTEFSGTALHLNYQLDSGVQLVSITSKRDAEFSLIGDDDMLPARIQTTFFDENNDQFTQEVRLQSADDSEIKWLAGVYYFQADRDTGRYARFDEDLYNVLIPPLAPFAAALSGQGAVPSLLEHESLAVFGQMEWAMTDALSMTVGFRYTEDEKSVDWRQVNTQDDPATAAFLQGVTGLPLTQAPGALFGAVNSEFKGDRKEDDFSPTISLQYQASEDLLLYARYAGAAKSGGYNADFMTNGLERFEYEQETVDSYELGLKGTFADNTLRVNLAAFEMQFDDFQVFQFLANSSGATSLELTNAAEASIQGVETEITWLPTSNLRFIANATLLDAAYDDFQNPGGGLPFTGNQLPYAPDLKYYLAAQYRTSFAGGVITFDVDYTYVDDQFTDPGNLAVDKIDSYDLLGAKMAFAPASESWELSLWGRNLNDEEYNKVNNDNFLGTPRTVWGDPRMYGVTFTYFVN